MTLDPDGDIDDPIGGDLSLYQQSPLKCSNSWRSGWRT
jgi:hypothetical protein